MQEKTVVYEIPEEMSDLDFQRMTHYDYVADAMEIEYNCLCHLKDVARAVLPEKITKKMDYEETCSKVLFGFDSDHQRQVAERLSLTLEQLLTILPLVSVGARLQKQKYIWKG